MRRAGACTTVAVALACAAGGCGIDAAPAGPEVVDDLDPLAVPTTPATGSLDELHARVIAPRCSGQPGLCHNGQFEPNLSTPALMYAYLVNRPGIERPDRLRVAPGDAAASLLIDKLRGRNGVATRMPLGAEPLEEADLAAIEAWIDGGALRAPGAEPAPVLNNPPRRPEIAVFDDAGTRLDGVGPIVATPGTTLVLRHSVADFETADAAIPFAAMVLQLADGKDVVVNAAAATDPHVARTTFDPDGPQGKGDQLDYQFTWTVPAELEVFDPATQARTTRPVAGETITVIAAYVDAGTPNISALDISTTPIELEGGP